MVDPATGNSVISAHNVYWDANSGTTSIVLLDSLATAVSVPGLTGGNYYKFKVRARNIYGNGDFSTELTVLASDKPDKVAIPTVTIGASDTAVSISWTEPGYHAAAIDEYEVRLLKSDGSFATITADCNSNAGVNVGTRVCLIEMTVVIARTSLSVDNSVRASIRAHNINGWGDYSELNTVGATIETVPSLMSAPTFEVASSSAASIALSWTAPTGAAKGGQNVAILTY